MLNCCSTLSRYSYSMKFSLLIFSSLISSLISPWHLNFYIPETLNYLHLSIHMPHAILYLHHLLTVFIFLTWVNSDVTSSSKSSVQTKREPPFCSPYRSQYYHPLSIVTAGTSERPEQLQPRPAQRLSACLKDFIISVPLSRGSQSTPQD